MRDDQHRVAGAVRTMTPTQLRAFCAVVQHGSVKDAAVELGVTEAAVSIHVAQLRKELDDQLFTRTGAGLAFTPGGLRLAGRATEMLGLQDLTIREVNQAGHGRRVLRLAATSIFAEHAAPGLIELFAARADDLEVELSVVPSHQFGPLLETRTVDVTIGPAPAHPPEGATRKEFLKYQIIGVTGPDHPLAGRTAHAELLRDQTWLLGPSAVERGGAVQTLVRRLELPEANQQIFQSHAAAVEEAKRNRGIALVASFAVAGDLSGGRLVRLGGSTGPHAEGLWAAMTLPPHLVLPAAAELLRFITTPRAIQAMLRGSGVNIARFRPSIHVTLWS